MPLITIAAASPDRQISTKARIAAEISRLSSNLLHKDPKVTAVIVTRSCTQFFLAKGLEQ